MTESHTEGSVLRRDYQLGPDFEDHKTPFRLLRYAMSVAGAGAAVEFGVGDGTSLSIITRQRGGLVVGFDSFAGLPEDWRDGYPKGTFAQPTVPSIPGALLVVGQYRDTLAGSNPFDLRVLGPVALVHIDCDLYSSTALALAAANRVLAPGCVVVFDEWHGYPGCEDHEQKAWHEWVSGTSVDWEVIGHSQQSWAIRITRR